MSENLVEERPGAPIVLRIRSRKLGIVEVVGRATRFPGLIATCSPVTGLWSLTHFRSGLSMGWESLDPECIMRFAEEVGPLGDWMLPAEDARYDALVAQTNEVAERLGLQVRRRHGRGPYDDLNETGARDV